MYETWSQRENLHALLAHAEKDIVAHAKSFTVKNQCLVHLPRGRKPAVHGCQPPDKGLPITNHNQKKNNEIKDGRRQPVLQSSKQKKIGRTAGKYLVSTLFVQAIPEHQHCRLRAEYAPRDAMRLYV